MIQYRAYKTHMTDPSQRERVGFMLSLVKTYANAIIGKYWNHSSLEELHNAIDLPSQQFMKYRRLGWSVKSDVYLPDRVKRMAEAQAMVILGEQSRLNQIVKALASEETVPAYTTSHDTDRLKKAISKQDGEVTGITSLYKLLVIRNVKLDAGSVDKQLYSLVGVEGRKVTVSVKLPLVSSPKKRRDWEWTIFEQMLPKTADQRYVKVCPPVITAKNLMKEFAFPER